MEPTRRKILLGAAGLGVAGLGGYDAYRRFVTRPAYDVPAPIDERLLPAGGMEWARPTLRMFVSNPASLARYETARPLLAHTVGFYAPLVPPSIADAVVYNRSPELYAPLSTDRAAAVAALREHGLARVPRLSTGRFDVFVGETGGAGSNQTTVADRRQQELLRNGILVVDDSFLAGSVRPAQTDDQHVATLAAVTKNRLRSIPASYDGPVRTRWLSEAIGTPTYGWIEHTGYLPGETGLSNVHGVAVGFDVEDATTAMRFAITFEGPDTDTGRATTTRTETTAQREYATLTDRVRAWMRSTDAIDFVPYDPTVRREGEVVLIEGTRPTADVTFFRNS